jgi:putative Holliday junction resolvase
MRVLGVDLGEERVGLAVSDPTASIAQPLKVLYVRRTPELAQAVAAVAKEVGAGAVVVGLPRHMGGGEGSGAQRARAFAESLRSVCHLPVHLWDERLTTVQAQRALRELHLSRARRRQRVDQTAAAIILQGYLDAHRESRA